MLWTLRFKNSGDGQPTSDEGVHLDTDASVSQLTGNQEAPEVLQIEAIVSGPYERSDHHDS